MPKFLDNVNCPNVQFKDPFSSSKTNLLTNLVVLRLYMVAGTFTDLENGTLDTSKPRIVVETSPFFTTKALLQAFFDDKSLSNLKKLAAPFATLPTSYLHGFVTEYNESGSAAGIYPLYGITTGSGGPIAYLKNERMTSQSSYVGMAANTRVRLYRSCPFYTDNNSTWGTVFVNAML